MEAKANQFFVASAVFKANTDTVTRQIKRAQEEKKKLMAERAAFMPLLKTISRELRHAGIEKKAASITVQPAGDWMPSTVSITLYDLLSFRDRGLTGLISGILDHCNVNAHIDEKDNTYSAGRSYTMHTVLGIKVEINAYLNTDDATCKIEKIEKMEKVTRYKVTCD
jgi:hypothetical protein